MAIHNLDLERVRIGPGEADAPLVVDPNAVLPLAIARQGLQTVARDDSKIRQGRGSVYVVEFPFR